MSHFDLILNEIESKNLMDIHQIFTDRYNKTDFSKYFDADEVLRTWTKKEEGKVSKFTYYTIYSNDFNEIVGFIGYDTIAMLNEFRLAHLNFALKKDYEGKGLMKEALKLLLEKAFKNQNVVKMICHLDKKNKKALKTLSKNKFIYSKTIDEDIIEYKITKPIYNS